MHLSAGSGYHVRASVQAAACLVQAQLPVAWALLPTSAPPCAKASLGWCWPQVKAAFAVRKWLAVNAQGEVRHLELAKLRVTQGLGVQLRDLRWGASCPTLGVCGGGWAGRSTSQRLHAAQLTRCCAGC